jgi:uncharacterized protein YigE (DUF2233 family)
MSFSGFIKLLVVACLITISFAFYNPPHHPTEDSFVSYVVDLDSQNLAFYWKDDTGAIISTINNLKLYVESKNLDLLFAINGGMFKADYSPKGLYIEKGKMIHPIEKKIPIKKSLLFVKPPILNATNIFSMLHNRDRCWLLTDKYIPNLKPIQTTSTYATV